jgi:hypothetical protein
MANHEFSIKGILLSRKDQQPLANLRIEAWDKDLLFDDFVGEAMSDANGEFTITFKQERFKEFIFDKFPDLYFKVFDKGVLIYSSENEVIWNYRSGQEKIILNIDWPPVDHPGPGTKDETYKVSGKVINSNGVALSNIIAEVFAKTLDKDLPLGKTQTDKEGNYSVSFSQSSAKAAPDLQTKVYYKGDENNFTLSPIRYNASKNEMLDVVVKVEKVSRPAEFDAILHDVQANLGQLKLNELKEDKDNQHISYLSNKTGWDARLTAMLVTAHQLGDQLKLNPAHIYSLLRSGVPGTAEALQSLSAERAETAIKAAIEKKIIPNTGNIQETLDKLNVQGITLVLNNKPFASVSTMNEMLSLRLNTDQKNIFAQTYKQVGNDTAKLWTALQQKGFSTDDISRLQLDGKLGFLTGNNAALVRKVYENFNISSDVELAGSGLYKASEWKKIIGPEKPADISTDEYAIHMANQVKMSYPTAVAAEMIKRDEINLGSNTPKEEVVGFFTLNQSKNTVGTNPVKTWDGFERLSTPAKDTVKTYERLYQISPSDESLVALINSGFHSAYQISRFTKDEFMMTHAQNFPEARQAELTYIKANEVYSASLGIATTYITNRSMPNLYAITGRLAKTPGETIAYTTLEELFGNMDYCSCEHCKSVLSPAAYLVELLEFIDLTGVPHARSNPIDVLLGKPDVLVGRRPDIQHIQLTCENTNMALPYIDLVNEILEYYILNGNLTNLKGHDITAETTQNELLAEPQFVEKTVYDLLKDKVYPYNLPFHQPLETLRLLFRIWGVSLENALSVFSTALASGKEALALNEDEYRTLTDLTFKKLPEYFGQPQNNTIAQLNAVIANGKTFSRTVGISYEDLVELLKTNFINPGYTLVPLFQKLHISLEDLQKFYVGTLSDAELDAMIPLEIIPADYGGDVKTWLRTNQQLIMGLIILTDIGSDAAECNFAEVELRYALPDNNNNGLTETAYHKFHRFLRMLRKTGWRTATVDNLLKVLLPVSSGQITDANIDETFVTVLSRMANFKKLAERLSFSEKKFPNLLLILDTGLALSLRQEQFAKLLKLSIPDMLELSEITGIDPLADDLEAEEPSLLKFTMIAQNLKAQSLKVVDLAYILHHKDLNGKLTPKEETLLKNTKILRDTLNAIEKENNVAPDNADFNFAKSKMLLVYDAETTDEFFGLLLSTKTFSADFITDEESLPVPLLLADAGIGFDPFKKKLTYVGVLSAAAKAALETAADALVLLDMGVITVQANLDTFIADFKTALNLIATGSNTELNSFALNFPELKTIYDSVKLELTPSDQSQKLVKLILPELKSKLKNNSLRQVLIGILKSDPDTVSVLTDRKENIKSAADATKPVLFDFMQLEEKLLFDQNQTYRFYIDIPVTDDYLLYVSAPQNTIVSLRVDGQLIINNITIGPAKEVKNAAPLPLKAGVIKLVEMTISSLPAGQQANILWRTKGITKTIIPDSAVYVANKVDVAKTSLIRLSKAAQLQNLFKFTPVELDYFASTNTETKDFLNNLDTDGTITSANLKTLWEKIELLVYFNSIKKENEPEDNTWVQVLKDPSVMNAQARLLLESFNFWQEADLAEVLTHFAFVRADLSKLSVLKKIMNAMSLITAIGYSAVLIETWITNNPSYELVAGIKSTVKLNVTEASWLETMQTVSDPVRNLLRDALVSYVLQYHRPSPEIINADKLYEYFLIDVEMDACMKTSRIRQALSTVQLFIQRCLINLEPLVDPASIKAAQWAWMKRYRVWEANRKVFLYPENWLEPELRDNKSSLFKELEGELLQGEVTDESAELAFLNYLKKLDDIAKLEMVGMYLEENEANNQDDDILHVFGRTNGNTRQYYYRRYEYGYWTPWEKVSLNIEGEHIFPIVWRKRLFVFWLNIFEKPAPVTGTKSAEGMRGEPLSTNARKNIEINMCWGEYYKGKWTSPKSTDSKRPMVVNNLGSFESNSLLIYGRKEKVENPAGKFRERVVFYLRYRGSGAGAGTHANGVFTFTSKNAAPYLEYIDDIILYNKVRDNLALTFFNPYSGTPQSVAFFNTNFLMPDKNFRVNVKQPSGATTTEVTENVLTKKNMLTNGFSILPTWHPVENQFEAPLGYADEHSTFFIKPDENVFIPINRYDGYYPVVEVPVLVEIPVLVEKPIRGWPPEEIINRGDIVSNPWEWSQNAVDINTNYTKMLATTQTYIFGNVEFGTGGLHTSTQNLPTLQETVKTF